MIAARGDIRPAEWQELKAHLDECVSCHRVFADMAEIHAKWLPERPGFELHRDEQSDLRHRQEILKALAKEGARFSRAARDASLAAGGRPNSRAWLLAAAAIVMFCMGLALAVPWLWFRPAASPIVVLRAPGTPALIAASDRGPYERKLEEEIERSRAAQARLSLELAAQQRKGAASDERSTARIADLNKQLEAARSIQHKAEEDLADLRPKYDTAEAVAAVQQSEIQYLNRKLSDQASSFDRERQVLALGGRDIRDLIAARNLHIIDVYDTDSKGKTKPAFGRIFYTEGKSLIFYAYDLNGNPGDAAKYAYHVWGKRDANPHEVRSLGALSKDDQVQKRWVFTTTDARVLASIDSVFVTIEPTERPHARPGGKLLLNAYLGTAANHP